MVRVVILMVYNSGIQYIGRKLLTHEKMVKGGDEGGAFSFVGASEVDREGVPGDQEVGLLHHIPNCSSMDCVPLEVRIYVSSPH